MIGQEVGNLQRTGALNSTCASATGPGRSTSWCTFQDIGSFSATKEKGRTR